MKRLFVCLFLIIPATGCSKKSSSTNGASAAATPKPAVTVDPSLLPMKVEMPGYTTNYTFQLPNGYESIPANSPKATTKIAAWRKADGDTVQMFSMHITSDPRMIRESQDPPRQMLLNFTAGVADSGKFTITERGPTEAVTSNGLNWHRLQWRGQIQGQSAVGWAYFILDQHQCFLMFSSAIGPNAEAGHKLLEASFGTIKRQ